MHIGRQYKLLSAFILLVVVLLLGTACRQKAAPARTNKPAPVKNISFKPILGIAYTEVRRVYDNGLSFAHEGYQLKPDWRITFLPNDTVRIYSPILGRFIDCPAQVDHANVVNVAWSWFRVVKMTKDSLVFKVLHVTHIIEDPKPPIIMTMYSNDYIKNVLHTTPNKLIGPSAKDTLFIKQRVKESDADYRKAFGATEPARITSINAKADVSRKPFKVDPLKNILPGDDYLSPTFNVVIHNAYANFNYFLVAIADEKGKLHYIKSLNYLYDTSEKANRDRVLKGIVDGYLSVYLKVIPGKTLGITHASPILLHVKGETK